MSKREEIEEHLIELLEQSEGDTAEWLAAAILWVLNEDGVVIKGQRHSQLAGYYTIEFLVDE